MGPEFMKFSYRKIPVNNQRTIAIPLLDVRLGNNQLPVVCIIDSGATFSFFHASLGEQLGLDIKSGIKMTAGGVTGAGFTSYLHKNILLEFGGCECFVNIAFSYELGTPFNLLGQHNFFEKFKVCFDLSKNGIEIIPRFN